MQIIEINETHVKSYVNFVSVDVKPCSSEEDDQNHSVVLLPNNTYLLAYT